MKTSRTVLFSSLGLVALAGLTLAQDTPGHQPSTKQPKPHGAESVAPGAKAANPSDFPIIGYIERRDRTITIKAGPHGPVYSVKTPAGKVLFENLSAEQLQAQAPDLHEFLKSAMAGARKPSAANDARVRVKPDASLRPK